MNLNKPFEAENEARQAKYVSLGGGEMLTLTPSSNYASIVPAKSSESKEEKVTESTPMLGEEDQTANENGQSNYSLYTFWLARYFDDCRMFFHLC